MFDEVQFPTGISYGSSGGPGFSTSVTILDSGAEHRVARYNAPRHSYNAAEGVKSYADLAALRAFFIARRGAEVGFRFKDFGDYTSTADGMKPPMGAAAITSTDIIIGTGDGAALQFQLVKKYISGAVTRTRNIKKPVEGTVRITLNSVLKTEGTDYSIDYTTGIITFMAAPGMGIPITAGFEFDVPVRFGDDVDKALQVQIDTFGSGSIPNIPLIELIDGGQLEDEYLYRGAKEISTAANFTLSVGTAVFYNISTTVGSIVVSLPDPTADSGLPPGGPYFAVANDGTHTFTLKDHLGATVATLTAGTACEVWLTLDSSNTKVWYAWGS